MNDYVKIGLVLVAILLAYKMLQGTEGFMSTVTTLPTTPSFATPLSDVDGLPLTDSLALPAPTNCKGQAAAIDTDLLPKPAVSGDDNFADFVPNPAAIANQSFLEPAKFIGMDTTSGNKKNQSYDLRSDIPIPDCPGAWGPIYRSVIQPDPWRKDICDGTLQGSRISS